MSIKLKSDQAPASFTFLTNYTHVLVCLKKENTITVRELSLKIGITERSVQRIISELLESDVISRTKIGRNNTYKINNDHTLHHPLESNHTVEELLELIG